MSAFIIKKFEAVEASSPGIGGLEIVQDNLSLIQAETFDHFENNREHSFLGFVVSV